ncbi:MAG: 1-acyl-sn-glycerol-3-phosphate acyltransferase [Zoogloeaceae bacterium]|nr:1-acyl-sn-glycerol-3-phosphate acyltransferase [Zoogloeaceae bacterium]
MIALRSALFMLALAIFTVPYTIGVMLCFPLPHRWRRHLVTPWVHVASWLIRHVLGINYRVLGREHIPDRPSVILSKHQSAWETIVLQLVFPWTVFVWKKELIMLPFFGWALATVPMISINRGAGKKALTQLVEQGRLRLSQGYWVIIFPEGTRTPIGVHRRYKIGGAHLAVETGAPVVPVALNAGEFWSRRAFIKYPGTVTVSIGPVIDPAGLSAEDVNARAEAWMEAEMRRISPHRYADHEADATTA